MANKIEAADFITATPPRVIGIECEYDPQIADESHTDRWFHQQAIVKDVLATDYGVRTIGVMGMLSNGARCHAELQKFVEWATAECLGPKQTVEADVAGQQQIAHIGNYLGITVGRGIFRRGGTYEDRVVQTQGYHQNFAIPSDTLVEEHQNALGSFLATRIYAMQGMVGWSGYTLSQKAPGCAYGTLLTTKLGSRTERNIKPTMLLWNGDDTTDGLRGQWSRLEVRNADPVISPSGQFLGLAAMSLAIRLVEHSRRYSKILNNAALSYPNIEALAFSQDLTLKQTAESANGKDLTALDVQEIFLEGFEQLDKDFELPADEKIAVSLLRQTIDSFRKSDPSTGYYAGDLPTQFDVAAKHLYLLRHSGGRPVEPTAANIQRDLSWDRIYRPGGAMKYWGKMPSPYIDDTEVERLKTEPPEGTRAFDRAKVLSEQSCNAADWSGATLTNGKRKRFSSLYRAAA